MQSNENENFITDEEHFVNFNITQAWSLKTKLTILISAILVVSIWSLTFYASSGLHKEMKDLAGEQQFSAVSFIAADINQELASRLKALEMVSSEIKPSMLHDTASLQALLEQRPLLQLLFNGGVFATGTDGIAIADVPLSVKRIGVNYIDRETVSIPIKTGKPMIGRPAIGKKLGAPIFSISVPISDTQSAVIGVLVGTINLNLPSFLDEITNNRYGKTGGYLLVDPQHEVVVTATDKRRIMTPTTRPGAFPMLDRFRQGYEGSGVFINPLGVEVLASAKGIPVAGWFVVATLSTTEAFAPIHKMQNHILLAAILLTLIAAALTWWILKGLLAPLFSTVEILSNITNSRCQPHPLPVARKDEIGKLIGSFNNLLTILLRGEKELQDAKSNLEKLVVERTVELQESERRLKFHLENSTWAVVEWDADFVVTQWSKEAERMFGWGKEEILGKRIDEFNLIYPEDIPIVAQTMERLTSSKEFALVAPSRNLNKAGVVLECIWYNSTLLGPGGKMSVMSLVEDVTERKLAEKALRAREADLSEAQRLAHIGSWHWDAATDVTTGSDELLRIYGFDPSTETMPDFKAQRGRCYPIDDWERINSAVQSTLKTGFGYQLDVRVIRDNGTIWVITRGEVVRDANNRIVGLRGTVQDITERKRAEELLQEDADRLAAVLEAQREIGGANLDYGPFLQFVLDRMSHLTGADGACLEIAEAGEMVYEAANGLAAGFVGLRLKAKGSMSGLCLASDELKRSDDTETDPRVDREACRRVGLRSMIVIPLHYDHHSFGVLKVMSRRANAFSADAEQKLRMMVGFLGVTVARKRAEEEVQKLNEIVKLEKDRLSALLNSITDEIWFADTDGKFTLVNSTGRREFALNATEFIDVEDLATSNEVLRSDGTPRPIEEAPPLRALRGETVSSQEELVRTPSTGELRYRLVSSAPVHDAMSNIIGAVSVVRDITDLKRTEEAIKTSLAEKEVMLREIHHRVKNNLQVISSLVSMQADTLTDERIHEELDEVSDRIRSMALVHEKLYQTDNLAQVDFADYASSMLSALWRSHGALADKIRLNFEVVPVALPIETAIPCGLILNELAINALKYAFPNGKDGEVTVGLENDPATNTVCLWVRDNGVGLPPGLDWRQSSSLGLRLVQILAGQLRGTVGTGTGPGTEFQITFSLNAKS
jgi:PAS domain S-box-containing protein